MKVFKSFLFTSFFLLLVFNVHANDILDRKNNDSLFIPHKNILKVRLFYPIYDLITINRKSNKIIGFLYERVLKPKQSFCVSFDYMNSYSTTFSQSENYGETIDSYSNQIMIRPEYRYYFNKRKSYPRGFHIGIAGVFGYAKGETQVSYQYIGSIGMGINPTYLPPRNTVFSVWIFGIGPDIGIQYFLGKNKRVLMSNTFGIYYCKNKLIKEYPPIGESYRMFKLNEGYPAGDITWTIGYTFGN